MNIHLCFHGIGTPVREREPSESRYWVKENVYLTILDEITRQANVVLSFDDGNKSDVSLAFPALQERGLRASFFPLAGRLHDSLSLDAADLTHLRVCGMDIGTHGWAHKPWRDLNIEEAEREFIKAREVLAEASGGTIDTAALPLGQYDRRLLHKLKVLKYRAVFTSDRLPSRADWWLQARYSVGASDTAETIRDVVGGRFHWGQVRNHVTSIIKRVR